MAVIGYYYLHENGDLIYKPGPDAVVDIRDSDLARGIWPLDQADRAGAWRIVVEAGAAGADPAARDGGARRGGRCGRSEGAAVHP